MARRRWYRVGGAALAVLVVAGAVTVFVATRQSPAQAAGCGPVQTVRPYPGGETMDRAHIGGASVKKPPALSTYPSHPPTSGPHDPTPLPAGVYSTPPPIYRTIHSLEHAAVLVWHSPRATGDALTDLEQFYRQPTEGAKVIVAPYSYPDEGAAGALPAGKAMVLVAWHKMQTCDDVSLEVAKQFVGDYRFDPNQPGRYVGLAPERTSPI